MVFGLILSVALQLYQGHRAIAAKNEERQLAELKRKKQNARGDGSQNQANKTNQQHQPPQLRKDNQRGKPTFHKQAKSYICDSPNHLVRDCRPPKTESQGKTQVVQAGTELDHVNSNFSRVTKTLFPSATHLQASTSTPTVAKCVEVKIEGVPVRGILATGSDITILSGSAFREIVTRSNLKKQDFKPADRKVSTYGQQPLHLDGQMDLNIKFGESCVRETVKLDAPDTLSLSENVCHTLKVVSYHPNVQSASDDAEPDN